MPSRTRKRDRFWCFRKFMTVTIYTAYHRPAPRIDSPSIRPLHVGRATAAAPLPGMAGDDTGETISDRNAAWC